MRGLMSDPSGQIMNLPIKKNFREGLTITDYLMSGYGARKGIVDTALKTANSGYLTRRLIDVSQDILIREKDCLTNYSFLFFVTNFTTENPIYEKILGRILNKPIYDPQTSALIADINTQITPNLIQNFKEKQITNFSIRSPLTCTLYRAICQKCYGWDLANENLVDIGEAIGILAGQSIGEPGTQLTMRTFHTGGIFTAEARQQIISPINGIIQFYKRLKTVVLRTNRGEDVLVTKNAGSLVIIPDDPKHKLIKIDILRNTILFPKNNQYISKDTVIGELINTNKQIKTEVKTILSDTSGEIFIPKLKQKINALNNNQLVWILSGQLYNSPKSSFLNFYPDYKLNKYSYIFRTKLINHYNGFLVFKNTKKSLYENLVKINNNKYSVATATLQQLSSTVNYKTHILTLDKYKYSLTLRKKYSKNYLELTRDKKFGTLITNCFKTLTGGIMYYDYQTRLKNNTRNKFVSFFDNYGLIQLHRLEVKQLANRVKDITISVEEAKTVKAQKKAILNLEKSIEIFKQAKDGFNTVKKICSKPIIKHRTLLWLNEEIHKVECDENMLLVEHGDFISKGFELIPGRFSKTSGIITIVQKNNSIRIISIKSGLVYKGKRLKNTEKKIYYPGEILFSNVTLQHLSFCEYFGGKNNDQLLVRPIELYEFAKLPLGAKNLKQNLHAEHNFKLESLAINSYKPNQRINGKQSLQLISNLLIFKSTHGFKSNLNIELFNSKIKKSVEFNIVEKLSLNNYITPNLRDKSLHSCFVIQKNQFVNSYSVLGYLETFTLDSQEIVKFKIKKQNEKQIFLISNNDCIIVPKKEILNKKVDDIIMSKFKLSRNGKIIIENDHFFTIQKGRPYFFPNCKNDQLNLKTNLRYKLFPNSQTDLNYVSTRNIFVEYYNLRQLSIRKNLNRNNLQTGKINLKSKFSKFFVKNAGKLYSCLIPQFSKKFALTTGNSELNLKSLICSTKLTDQIKSKFDRTILLQSSKLISNRNRKKDQISPNSQLTLLKFVEQPFTKVRKAVGLYAITEDYFEQDLNSVFCKNAEFIEPGKTLGLLNLEKEITGDIVQGLPRIEEILEARKKNMMVKRIPTSQKKGLVTQKTSLDVNFEFKKVGTPIKENDKINPHKLVKVYFNYYGLLKFFLCDKTHTFRYARLINNYEACYKSFKKVQLFILDSVQSVYKSQGVTINDKHLEVIIKQMTTKVLITSQGDTPLLRREVIDLYHIQYINNILRIENKQSACYIPLLLGITKAALNNPSFISAASFQETTRVLTKAAIEGRIDWLRGLKENIIIGHLIPAGTGSPNYKQCFKKYPTKDKFRDIPLKSMSEESQKTRQIAK